MPLVASDISARIARVLLLLNLLLLCPPAATELRICAVAQTCNPRSAASPRSQARPPVRALRPPAPSSNPLRPQPPTRSARSPSTPPSSPLHPPPSPLSLPPPQATRFQDRLEPSAGAPRLQRYAVLGEDRVASPPPPPLSLPVHDMPLAATMPLPLPHSPPPPCLDLPPLVSTLPRPHSFPTVATRYRLSPPDDDPWSPPMRIVDDAMPPVYSDALRPSPVPPLGIVPSLTSRLRPSLPHASPSCESLSHRICPVSHSSFGAYHHIHQAGGLPGTGRRP